MKHLQSYIHWKLNMILMMDILLHSVRNSCMWEIAHCVNDFIVNYWKTEHGKIKPFVWLWICDFLIKRICYIKEHGAY